jgi:hypothetical protein
MSAQQQQTENTRAMTRQEQRRSIVVEALGMVTALSFVIGQAFNAGVHVTEDFRVDEDAEKAADSDAPNFVARQEAAAALRDGWERVEKYFEQLAQLAVDFMRATEALPSDTYAAASQLAAHQVAFENASRLYVDTLEMWREADTQTGRIRQGVIERLMSTDATLSRTAADKAASGDDEYTQPKDRCARLSDQKDRADVERNVAYSKVETSRALLNALIQVEAANRLGKVTVKYGELHDGPQKTGAGPKVAH